MPKKYIPKLYTLFVSDEYNYSKDSVYFDTTFDLEIRGTKKEITNYISSNWDTLLPSQMLSPYQKIPPMSKVTKFLFDGICEVGRGSFEVGERRVLLLENYNSKTCRFILTHDDVEYFTNESDAIKKFDILCGNMDETKNNKSDNDDEDSKSDNDDDKFEMWLYDTIDYHNLRTIKTTYK